MGMARGLNLFHTLLLVFAWECCGKVSATFDDVTGVVDVGFNHRFSFHAFGSHGIIGKANVGGIVESSLDMQSPTEAPGVAPVGVETPMSTSGNNKALSFGLEIIEKNKNNNVIASIGLKTPKMKGDAFLNGIKWKNGGKIIAPSHNAGKIGLKIKGSVYSHGRKIGLKSTNNNNVVVSHAHKISHVVSNGGKINLKSNGNVVSYGR